MEATTVFKAGTTYNPNPSKKKKKTKMEKVGGLTFPRFKDILLVKTWLAITMDPKCGTGQKGNKYWEKIWKECHEQK